MIDDRFGSIIGMRGDEALERIDGELLPALSALVVGISQI